MLVLSKIIVTRVAHIPPKHWKKLKLLKILTSSPKCSDRRASIEFVVPQSTKPLNNIFHHIIPNARHNIT
jgi:hypothetical protein